MDRYIDVEKVRNYFASVPIDETHNIHWRTDYGGLFSILEDNRFIADVVPVVHAHWNVRTAEWTFPVDCSHCGMGFEHRTRFCPNCGAKMDGGTRDGMD